MDVLDVIVKCLSCEKSSSVKVRTNFDVVEEILDAPPCRHCGSGLLMLSTGQAVPRWTAQIGDAALTFPMDPIRPTDDEPC